MPNKKDNFFKTSSIKKMIIIFLWIFIALITIVLGLNAYVCVSSNEDMYQSQDYAEGTADCIMVLGCGVKNGKPTPMLKDRLDTAIELYKTGVAEKIIMSGDHGKELYNEVGVMKLYAIKNGVNSSDIFMDHAGFSTYESLYRAKNLFECKKIIAVTQRYHLYRTVYLGKSLGLDICGVSTNDFNYGGFIHREIREILARNKDFFTSLIKPKPKMPLGEKISLLTSGDVTNDEAFLKLAKENNIKLN